MKLQTKSFTENVLMENFQATLIYYKRGRTSNTCNMKTLW